jgi:hypothetical protein
MPTLGQKHFAYTPEGHAQYVAAKAATKTKTSKPKDTREDDKERQMGATAFIKDKMGFNSGGMGDFAEHETLKDAQNAIGDILSESHISDLYPEAVWNKAANALVARMWAQHKKRGGEGAPRKRYYKEHQLAEVRQGQRR